MVVGLTALASMAGASTYFLDTFDTDPVLSATATAGAWYPDRFPPAQFNSAVFDGGQRLLLGISANDAAANRPAVYQSAFYNTQGRKYDLWNPVGSFIAVDLYIGAGWQTSLRSANLWATTFGDDTVTGFPTFGFTNAADDGSLATGRFRVFSQTGWQDLDAPLTYGSWNHLAIELTATSYDFYLDGNLVYSDPSNGSTQFGNMMLQAYNFGSSYDVYWDNAQAGLSPTPAPLPGTLGLLGSGLVGLAVWRRRRLS